MGQQNKRKSEYLPRLSAPPFQQQTPWDQSVRGALTPTLLSDFFITKIPLQVFIVRNIDQADMKYTEMRTNHYLCCQPELRTDRVVSQFILMVHVFSLMYKIDS